MFFAPLLSRVIATISEMSWSTTQQHGLSVHSRNFGPLLLNMLPFGPSAQLLAILVATMLALRAVKRKSLTQSGAIAAWFVGYLSVVTGLRGFVLLFFYQIGSWATKYKKTLKQEKDASAAESSARGASQVLACSVIAVVLSLLRARYCGEEAAVGTQSFFTLNCLFSLSGVFISAPHYSWTYS